MKRIVLLVLGFLALVLGGIGIFLPVLPTTPFVLCAAGCFAASSPALYEKLLRTRYFGEYIRNYKEKTGISARTRWTGIIFLWLMLGISAVLVQKTHVWIILGVVGVCVSIHILTIRRKR
ncbi:MAG: YbaN family protein [Christensenellales bacterium]